jgi:hypothetical protein
VDALIRNDYAYDANQGCVHVNVPSSDADVNANDVHGRDPYHVSVDGCDAYLHVNDYAHVPKLDAHGGDYDFQ